MRVSEQKVAVAEQVNPSKIMQVGMGFWASKILLTAVNTGLFTLLAEEELSAQNIKTKLGFHDRGLYDFLDSLVALGFLQRAGLKETAKYSNSPDAEMFLDKNKPSYVGGILEMANHRLYGFWASLEEALKTGELQNEAKNSDTPFFEILYSDQNRLNEFINAMAGVQMGNFIAFANKFDFSNYKTLCDIGGAGGYLAAQVVLNNDNMSCISFDLPKVSAIADETIKGMNLSERIAIESGDFFVDDFPKADVITMGNILHDWGTDEKELLIQKAYNALPEGGAFVVIENIIDNDRSKNAFGLMMSLNMLIETEAGYDFTFADFNSMVKEAGFKETSIIPLTGPTSAVIAYK
jgi:precorrin-6B methylase 2